MHLALISIIVCLVCLETYISWQMETTEMGWSKCNFYSVVNLGTQECQSYRAPTSPLCRTGWHVNRKHFFIVFLLHSSRAITYLLTYICTYQSLHSFVTNDKEIWAQFTKHFTHFVNIFHENSLPWIQNWKCELEVNIERTRISAMVQVKYMTCTLFTCGFLFFIY